MKNLMILVFAAFSFNVALTAQVKDQFRDRENSSTIVVVKEDNAIDQAVLNEYFDLADMSMNDQIMIMTAPEEEQNESAKDIENASASTEGGIEDFFQDLESKETTAETEETISKIEIPVETEVTAEVEVTNNDDANQVIAKKAPSTVSSKSRTASNRAKGTYTVKNSADVKKAAQRKYFGKKKKKRKKKIRFFGRKKSNACYSF